MELSDSQLDSMVATHIMQWQSRLWRQSEPYWDMPNEEAHGTLLMHDQWQPTRKIEQAFMALEKLREQPDIYYLADVTMRPLEWICHIETERGLISVVADSAPRAICLAALRAVGVDVDNA